MSEPTPSNEDCADLIVGFPLFAGLTRQGARLLIEPGEVREHAAGDTLFSEGEPSAFVLLVLTGRLERFVTGDAGDVTLSRAEPGSLAGELGVLCGLPRSASLRAIERSTVLRWSATAFRSILLRDAALSERVFRHLLRAVIDEERSVTAALAGSRDTASKKPD